VHRDEVLRLHEAEHQLELLARSMAGDVAVHHRLVVDHRAFLEEVVDRLGDCLLVPWDRAGRDDHGVARLDVDVPMVAVAHPRQPAHRLTL
jgi:hypothetical protein